MEGKAHLLQLVLLGLLILAGFGSLPVELLCSKLFPYVLISVDPYSIFVLILPKSVAFPRNR